LNVDFFDSEMHQTQHLVVRAMAAQSFSRFATPPPLSRFSPNQKEGFPRNPWIFGMKSANRHDKNKLGTSQAARHLPVAWGESRGRALRSTHGGIPMSLIVIIIILLLLFGGGGGYYAHRTYGGRGLGGVLGLVLIVILILWLVGGLH
jgi:hypothetical protein